MLELDGRGVCVSSWFCLILPRIVMQFGISCHFPIKATVAESCTSTSGSETNNHSLNFLLLFYEIEAKTQQKWVWVAEKERKADKFTSPFLRTACVCFAVSEHTGDTCRSPKRPSAHSLDRRLIYSAR